MESHLLDILVCPLCKGHLQYDREAQELTCHADKLAFPIRDGIPVMLESEARVLTGAAASSATTGTAEAAGSATAAGTAGTAGASSDQPSSPTGGPDSRS